MSPGDVRGATQVLMSAQKHSRLAVKNSSSTDHDCKRKLFTSQTMALRENVLRQMRIKKAPIVEHCGLFRCLAQRVLLWKLLARYLLVHDEEIERISSTYEHECEQCYKMLCTWKNLYGDDATYYCLAEGLQNIRQESLIFDFVNHQGCTVPSTESYMKCGKQRAANRVPGQIYRIELDRGSIGNLVWRVGHYLDECQRNGYKGTKVFVHLE